MISNSAETIIIENDFGIVTNKRVTYMVRKLWFAGNGREDVPLKQIVSVRYDVERHLLWGLFLIFFGLALLQSIVGIIPLILGIALLWGFPIVNIVTAGGTTRPVTGWQWQKKEAGAFVNALRDQIFSEE